MKKLSFALLLSAVVAAPANAAIFDVLMNANVQQLTDLDPATAGVQNSFVTADRARTGEILNAEFIAYTDEAAMTRLDAGTDPTTSTWSFTPPAIDVSVVVNKNRADPLDPTGTYPVLAFGEPNPAPPTAPWTQTFVTVRDNLAVDATNSSVFAGLLPNGSYDELEVQAASPYFDAAGNYTSYMYWTLFLFGPDTWFTGASLVPDAFPNPVSSLPNYVPAGPTGAGLMATLLLGEELDPATGTVLTGELWATNAGTSIASVAAVPVPAAVWLLGSGLIGLVAVGRRRHDISAAS